MGRKKKNYKLPLLLLFNKRRSSSNITQSAIIDNRKYIKDGVDTVLFHLVNPKYIPILEPVLEVIKKSKNCRAKIIITGTKVFFNLNGVPKRLKKYDIIYFPEEKLHGIRCDYLITTTPQFIGQIEKGNVIHLPHLTTEAMHYFSLLFEDATYCDGTPLSNKVNHVICTYNKQGALCKLPVEQFETNAAGKSQKVRIAIFSQLTVLWQCAESVYEAMINDDRCEVSVIQLPFYHENYKQEKDIGEFLRSKQIPFIDWRTYDAFWESPDVIIFLSPYDSTRPEGFKFEELYNYIPKTVCIPYALGVSGGYIIDYNFRQPIHTFGWKIYVRSQKYCEMFKRHCLGDASNVVVSGHPKMDLVHKLNRREAPQWLVNKIKDRKVLLWNPHHTVKQDEWSTFEQWNELMMDIFTDTKDAFLLIRPHPLLFKNFASLPDGQSKLDGFYKRSQNMDNVFIDLSDSYLDAFKVSDGMISDASSLLLEYLPTQKPILYTHKVGGGLLNDDGKELVQYLYEGVTKEQIINFIDMVMLERDPMRELRTAQIENFLYTIDGMAGQRIKDDIINNCI